MHEGKTEEQLRADQRALNAKVNALRQAGKLAEARKLREKVLQIQAARDAKTRERIAGYERELADAISASVSGEAAAAVSEAERILG